MQSTDTFSFMPHGKGWLNITPSLIHSVSQYKWGTSDNLSRRQSCLLILSLQFFPALWGPRVGSAVHWAS